jgi:hypothetical protein
MEVRRGWAIASIAAAALGAAGATDHAVAASAAGGATTVAVAVPAPGQVMLARARIPVTGRAPLAPDVNALGVPPGVTVVGGAIRSQGGDAVLASVVVATPLGASVSGSVRVRVLGVRAGGGIVVRETGLDLSALSRGERHPGPRIGRLSRRSPIEHLAGPRLAGHPAQLLARKAFWVLNHSRGPTPRRVAAEIGHALGLPPPPPPPPRIRRFAIEVPPYPSPVQPVRCSGRPSMVALQDADAVDRFLLRGDAGLAGLAGRQVPYMALGSADPGHRPRFVWGYDLVRMSAAQMASTLRQAIDAAPNHLVVVDRIEGVEWSDGAPAEPPVLDPASKGAALKAAMATLDVPSRHGGSYASRVHFWIGPGLHSSVGAGLGPNHNLGRDGKPHRRTYHAALEGMARGGGVWNQMFHGPAAGSAADPMSVAAWMRWPAGFADMFTRLGGGIDRVHFIFMEMGGLPSGSLPPESGDPMAASFALAAQPGTNSRILCNGPGALRVESQGRAWLQAFDRAFPATRP